jgi:hypothetical protein
MSSKTKILDSNPNSIYGASKKLATIAVHNMKNPAVLDNNLINLGATPPIASTTSTAAAATAVTKNNQQQSNLGKLQTSKLSTPIVKNTDVDEFLNKINEANFSLEEIYIFPKHEIEAEKQLAESESESEDEDEEDEDEDEEDEEDNVIPSVPQTPKAEMYSFDTWIIQDYSKFNIKMNYLLILYKGKIKPNLRTIDKKDILDMLKDMSILESNFKEVNLFIGKTYHNIYEGRTEKKHQQFKVDTFIDTAEKNFNKIASYIISSLKAFESLGITGGGLRLNIIRNRENQNHKYLL